MKILGLIQTTNTNTTYKTDFAIHQTSNRWKINKTKNMNKMDYEWILIQSLNQLPCVWGCNGAIRTCNESSAADHCQTPCCTRYTSDLTSSRDFWRILVLRGGRAAEKSEGRGGEKEWMMFMRIEDDTLTNTTNQLYKGLAGGSWPSIEHQVFICA